LVQKPRYWAGLPAPKALSRKGFWDRQGLGNPKSVTSGL
jgi:hypothetical protein